MRLCNNAVLAAFMVAAVLTLPAQQKSPAPSTAAQPGQAPSLSEDRDPVRSPDLEAPSSGTGPLVKEGSGYVLRADVEEVVMYCSVLEGNKHGPGPEKGKL